MADPADAASASAAANDADVDDLYADLDDQVTAALAAAGESGGSNAKDSDGANEAVDLGDGLAGYSSSSSSSSEEESEDDLHIVLNEDGCAPPPPSAGRCDGESEERELRASLLKGLSGSDGGLRKLGGHHYRGLLDKTTAPITGQGDIGHQHAFQKDYYFFLPRNRTVFDVNIEAFQQKPWRQRGVDLTDYFNFGLDEEGWRKYCFGMKQFTQKDRSLAGKSLGMDQESYHNLESCKSMPKPGTYSEFNASDDLDKVNMTRSPSNHSNSYDNSTVNDKCMTTERILANSPGVKCLKETSLVVDRVVDKGVLSASSSECTGDKLDLRDSACTRGHSSSPDYSDMLSEESTDDRYFKRANRHSNSKVLHSDTKFKDANVRSVLCRQSSKSDQESNKGDSHISTPSPSDDRYHKATKFLRTHEPDFKSSGVYANRQNGYRILKPGREGEKEQKRKSSARVRHDRHDVFNKEETIADRHPSRYAREYEGKRSDSTFLSNDCRNGVRDKVYEKRDYSPIERAALRNDVQHFSRVSNHQRSRSWHEFNDDEDVVQNFSSAKGWQQRHDYRYGYKSMLKAEVSDDIDGRVYRESYYQETRRVRHETHDHSEDDEFFHYNGYRSRELRGPEVRGEYRSRRSAESNYEHLGHPYHLVLSPQANDYPKNSERNWPSPGLVSLRSRNRCIDNERIRHAEMMRYDHDGYDQDSKQHSSSVHIGNIQRSAAAAETGYCILPVKRRLHADMGSINHKDFDGLAFPKGRRLTHHQSMISDQKPYAAEVHNSPNDFVREAICSFSVMRNNKTISNIERRHERLNFQLKDADSIHLNNRKRKFKRQGNETRCEIESESGGCLAADKNLDGSKHQDVCQKVKKLNGSYQHTVYQDLEKKTCQKRQNPDADEIEEGELIEEDHQDTVPESKFSKPRKLVLRSVVEASSAAKLETASAMSKDVGATKECDEKRILAVMEKMQKRRDRFKEPVVAQKEEDNGKAKQLTVACAAEDAKNQRPARKRRWGGNG
ncbi:hypothetical protein QYE76_068455 [Lolium multiflorum]|uniref:Pre-mRNA polyadenylation factor Fip1 domain-containing protein n=1 Tax=Lolium multiflorum TaxID=4521 RepID=A0AAD8SEI7_LOLMU|nr:hypothetical protein QYE76_068455 [Lolium multiflorum]